MGRGEVSEGAEVHRLSAPDGQGADVRRGERINARPYARADRVGGDGAGQACVLPKAADAYGVRSARDARGGKAAQSGHANGKPDSVASRLSKCGAARARWGDREGEGRAFVAGRRNGLALEGGGGGRLGR